MKPINLSEIRSQQEDQDKGKGPLADMLKIFNDKIEEAILTISTILTDENKLKCGYNKSTYSTELFTITEKIADINDFALTYQLLLKPHVPRGLALFQELRDLPFNNRMEMDLELKKRFIKANGITIPNFPNFKIEKLIEAYEFKSQDLNIIAQMMSLIPANLSFPYEEYYDDELGCLKFSKEQKDCLLEKHALYISTAQIEQTLATQLLCSGLSHLRRDPYSFKSLPEIDYRLMNTIKISKRGDLIVDVDKLEEAFKVTSNKIPTITRKSKHE